MNERKLIRRLREEANDAVPDVRARVLAEVSDSPAPVRPVKKRKRMLGAFAAGLAAVAACLAIVLPLTLRGYGGRYTEDYAAVYFKINPAVELTVKDGLVTAARPLNRDGVILLEKQTLLAQPVENVCASLAAEAQKTEYLTAGKAITVCVSGKDEDAILTKVRSSLSSYRLEIGQSAETLQHKADSYGIGTGKMQLIEMLLAKDASLNAEKLAKKDSDDLIEMLEDYDEEDLDGFRTDFEAQYRAAFGDFAKTLKKSLQSYIGEVRALLGAIDRGETEDLSARVAAVNETYALLGQKYEIPLPENDDWDDYKEELEECIEEAEETLEELADDPDDVYEDMFEDAFEDWLDGFKISMKQ